MSNPDNSQWFRLKFRDGREIEVHCSNAIQIFQNKYERLFSEDAEILKKTSSQISRPASEKKVSEDFQGPVIKTSKSNMENLKALFDTDWAKSGRTIRELTKALELNAVPDEGKNVSTNLRRMIKAGSIRRLGEKGDYRFYPQPKSQ